MHTCGACCGVGEARTIKGETRQGMCRNIWETLQGCACHPCPPCRVDAVPVPRALLHLLLHKSAAMPSCPSLLLSVFISLNVFFSCCHFHIKLHHFFFVLLNILSFSLTFRHSPCLLITILLVLRLPSSRLSFLTRHEGALSISPVAR